VPQEPTSLYAVWEACNFTGGTCSFVLDTDVTASQFRADFATACPPEGVANPGDGILPYRRSYGGATCRDSAYIHYNLAKNWFHFGRPSNVARAAEREPIANITNTTDQDLLEKNATVWTSLGVKVVLDAAFGQITVNSTLSLGSRDGFAVVQMQEPDPDIHIPRTYVRTSLSAQSKADLTIVVSAKLLGWISPKPTTVVVPLGDTGNRRGTTPWTSSIQYFEKQPTQFASYISNGTNFPDPEAKRAQCLQAARTETTPTPPGNPGDWIKRVATAAVNQMHPCNVRVCNKDTLIQTDYKWNNTTRTLVVNNDAGSGTGKVCTICSEVEMNLCNASGAKVKDQNGDDLDFVISRLAHPPSGCLQ
jgi:hypothetical protein